MALVGLCLLWVLATILRGPRADTRGWHDTFSKMGRPEGSLATYVLGALSLAQLTSWVAGNAPAPVVGFVLGASTAVFSRVRLATLALDIVGVAAGLAIAARYLAGDSPFDRLSAIVRVVSLLLVMASFIGGTLVGLILLRRSPLSFGFAHGRGLAFFGLTDIFVFLVSPAGADLSTLDRSRFLVWLVVAVVAAVALGATTSQFTLVVTAILVAFVDVVVAVAGLAPPGIATYFFTGLIGYAAAQVVRGR